MLKEMILQWKKNGKFYLDEWVEKNGPYFVINELSEALKPCILKEMLADWTKEGLSVFEVRKRILSQYGWMKAYKELFPSVDYRAWLEIFKLEDGLRHIDSEIRFFSLKRLAQIKDKEIKNFLFDLLSREKLVRNKYLIVEILQNITDYKDIEKWIEYLGDNDLYALIVENLKLYNSDLLIQQLVSSLEKRDKNKPNILKLLSVLGDIRLIPVFEQYLTNSDEDVILTAFSFIRYKGGSKYNHLLLKAYNKISGRISDNLRTSLILEPKLRFLFRKRMDQGM